mmetsp:Transcript_19032/g.30790  ORF Transcript_19032/g.30790 Transcript_19032/m.30790 type:complete len:131 (-) Transcript_19032:44-436(-)
MLRALELERCRAVEGHAAGRTLPNAVGVLISVHAVSGVQAQCVETVAGVIWGGGRSFFDRGRGAEVGGLQGGGVDVLGAQARTNPHGNRPWAAAARYSTTRREGGLDDKGNGAKSAHIMCVVVNCANTDD